MKTPKNREILLYVFFIVLAAAFWLFQVVNEDYEQELKVPLQIVNVPNNVVLTSEVPDYLHIRVRDKGSNLFSYVYGGGMLPAAVVDFAEYKNAGGHVRILTSELLKPILAKCNFTYLGARPDTLEFFYNYGLCKKVPVRLQGSIVPLEGYSLADVRLNCDSVLVYASKAILDTITAAWLRPESFVDVTDTLICEREIQPIRGAKFRPATIRMSAYTDRMVEKTVQVPVQGVNFPAGKHLQTFPAKVNITFQVGMKMYRDITEENFILVLNYEDLMQSETNHSHLALKSVPLGVTQVKINPDDVEFIIEENKE